MDTVIVEHERRITTLENKMDVNFPPILARVERLEKVLNDFLEKADKAKEQEKADEIQKARAELHELRQELDRIKADNTIKELKK